MQCFGFVVSKSSAASVASVASAAGAASVASVASAASVASVASVVDAASVSSVPVVLAGSQRPQQSLAVVQILSTRYILRLTRYRCDLEDTWLLIVTPF